MDISALQMQIICILNAAICIKWHYTQTVIVLEDDGRQNYRYLYTK